MGRLLSRAPVAGVCLFDWRFDISSSRPDFPHGRCASTASSFLTRATRVCPAHSVPFRQRRRYRGELAIGRASRVTNLYSAGHEGRTMMQSCASAAKLRGGGPILNRGAKAIVQRRVAAASARRLQLERRCNARLQQLRRDYAAGRSRRPSGASPVVASRHRTMRSLRASATIIVLRTPRRPSAVRLRYHALSGLPFWCVR